MHIPNNSAHTYLSSAFGIADTREACVESAQRVYDRLLLRTPGEDILSFETLALVAKDKDDDLDEEIAKALIKIFRPDRDGNLQLLDFVKSVDNVYKSCRLLSANIRNAKYTDAAVESIVNFCFWFAIGIFVLSELGLDPWAILLSLSSLIISLSFALGTTASKYFDVRTWMPECADYPPFSNFLVLSSFPGNVICPPTAPVW